MPGDRPRGTRPVGAGPEISRCRFGTCAKIGLDHPDDGPGVTRHDRPNGTPWIRLALALSIGLLLTATMAALVVAEGGIAPGPASGGLPARSATGVTEYAVTFLESGLAAGTNWSVTILGTTINSTSDSIVFQEPDGSYLFIIGPVAGYSYGPEGNVTVNGAPATVPILFTSTASGPGCTSYNWQGGNFTLNGDCRGFFEINLRSFNATTGWTFENSTFDVGAIAEVNSAGDLVALSAMDHESIGSISVATQGNDVNFTDRIVANVTTVVGLDAESGSPNGQTPVWSPNEAPGSIGPTVWGSGATVLGSIEAVLVLHFVLGPTTSDRVRFDVSMTGWPWVNPGDSLGVVVGASAQQQTYFAYTASNDTIAQRWLSNGTVASSLVFDPTANATTGGVNSTLEVSDRVGLYPTGTSPNIAFALLSFQGTGGYSAMTYDPWIVFGATRAVVGPPPPTVLPGGATLPWVAVGGIALATAVLGVIAYQVRRHRVDEGLRSAS